VLSISINFRNYVTFIETSFPSEGTASLEKAEYSLCHPEKSKKHTRVSRYRRFQINLLTRAVILLEIAWGKKHPHSTIPKGRSHRLGRMYAVAPSQHYVLWLLFTDRQLYL